MGCICGFDGEMERERRRFQTGAAAVVLPVAVCPECRREYP